MTFEPGDVLCDRCGDIEPNHCPECGSCEDDPAQDCCTRRASTQVSS